MLGRQFTGVFTPVIRLDLVKESAPKTWLVSVEHPVKHDGIRQERFKANDSLMFDIAIRSNDEELLGRFIRSIIPLCATTRTGHSELSQETIRSTYSMHPWMALSQCLKGPIYFDIRLANPDHIFDSRRVYFSKWRQNDFTGHLKNLSIDSFRRS
jgi:hypothetical protein